MRDKLYRIIFHHDTKAGKLFDVILLWLILLSGVIVMLDSVKEIHDAAPELFFFVEMALTVVFTIEYLLRIWCLSKPLPYIFSFWGFIDLLSILPTYLSLIFSGMHYLLIVRIFRLMRIFRVLKLVRYNREAEMLFWAMKASMHKISVFFLFVIAIVIFIGTIMYVVEGHEGGFKNIPLSIYWAIVTVTTVGFGDIVPQTVIGKFIASAAMILGYSIMAVPTGIITVELSRKDKKNRTCLNCGSDNPPHALYCNQCGDVVVEIKEEDF